MAPLEDAGVDGVAFVVGEKIYYGLGVIHQGNNNERYPTDIWEFDPMEGPEGKWTPVTQFPTWGREGAVVFVQNGKAHIGTGYNRNLPFSERYRSDFYALGHFVLFLLYSSYESSKEEQPWYKELTLSVNSCDVIMRMLQMKEPYYENVQELMEDVRCIIERMGNTCSKSF